MSGLHLMIVVVAYQRPWAELKPLDALIELCAPDASPRIDASQILIYENGPDGRLAEASRNAGFHHISDPSNGGTRSALLACRRLASTQRCKWLVLFDHDTSVTNDYFAAIAAVLDARTEADAAVAVLVPRVLDHGQFISPSRLCYAGRIVPLEQPALDTRHLTAIASASVVLCSAFDTVLPIPEHYWLDGLDHWLFWKLRRAGFTSRVVDASLEHGLSVGSLRSVSDVRYANIVASELHLSRETMGLLERWTFRLRLTIRALKLFKQRLPRHARMTLIAAARGTA